MNDQMSFNAQHVANPQISKAETPGLIVVEKSGTDRIGPVHETLF